MKLLLSWTGKNYRADLQGLPGSPPVGVAPTPELAVFSLFMRIWFSRDTWEPFIKTDELISIQFENLVDSSDVSVLDKCTCGVFWSDDESQFVGFCVEFEDLRALDSTKHGAFGKILALVSNHLRTCSNPASTVCAEEAMV